jgi:hypothetical protein
MRCGECGHDAHGTEMCGEMQLGPRRAGRQVLSCDCTAPQLAKREHDAEVAANHRDPARKAAHDAEWARQAR